MNDLSVRCVLAGILGCFVGSGELISRYRDAPFKALSSLAAASYIFINSLACVAALITIDAIGWSFGATPHSKILVVAQVLVAGTSAMALFRSSLFIVRIGDRDVRVGPSEFLSVLLSATDCEVDRRRALERNRFISESMKSISYNRARSALPEYCFRLMQNLPFERREEFNHAQRVIDSLSSPDSVKVKMLGFALLNVIGMDVLDAAVKSLREELRPIESEAELPVST